MDLIKKIINLFADDFSEKEFSEDDDRFVYKVALSNLKIPTEGDLAKSLSGIPERDKFVLMVIIDDEAISYTKIKDRTPETFLSKLSSAQTYVVDDSSIDLKIEIFKKNVKSILTIYSFNKIIEAWSGYSITNVWFCFGRILQHGLVCFEVMEKITPFHTESICFFNFGESPPENWGNNAVKEKRNVLNELLAENCHFANSYDCKLIPEDFYLQKKAHDSKLNDFFSEHCLIMSLVYIFDITSRDEDDVLFYKIRGYRQISGVVKLGNNNESVVQQYYGIYQWTYNEGNLSDKIGLARNIITIHIRGNNPLDLAEDVLSSIRSGYDIYLKQNISQYIATKEQVVENIHRMNQRANQIADTIALPFRNCLLAIVTFFASMTIIRVSLTQRFDRIFTTEILILSVFFILISMIYMLFLFFEIGQETDRFEGNYRNLKTRYQDILDKLDINNIFNNDLDHKADLDYIKKKSRRYAWAWSATHFVLFMLIVWLTFFCPKSFNWVTSNSKSPSFKNIHIISENINKISKSSKLVDPEKLKSEGRHSYRPSDNP